MVETGSSNPIGGRNLILEYYWCKKPDSRTLLVEETGFSNPIGGRNRLHDPYWWRNLILEPYWCKRTVTEAWLVRCFRSSEPRVDKPIARPPNPPPKVMSTSMTPALEAKVQANPKQSKKVPSPLEKSLTYLNAEDDSASDSESLAR